MENTLENKEKFFAQYWGQEVLLGEDETIHKLNAGDMAFGIQFNWLELKPLSSITDEDAINLGYGYVSHFKSNLDRNIDQLRNLGFAVPWMDLSVEDLVEYGWIKLKEN